MPLSFTTTTLIQVTITSRLDYYKSYNCSPHSLSLLFHSSQPTFHAAPRMMFLKPVSDSLGQFLITLGWPTKLSVIQVFFFSSTFVTNTLPIHHISYTLLSFSGLTTSSSFLTRVCNCYTSPGNTLPLLFKWFILIFQTSAQITRELHLQILSIISSYFLDTNDHCKYLLFVIVTRLLSISSFARSTKVRNSCSYFPIPNTSQKVDSHDVN